MLPYSPVKPEAEAQLFIFTTKEKIVKKCLLILARFPVSRRVKSRLATAIGPDKAADVQKGMLLDLLNRFLRVTFVRILCANGSSDYTSARLVR